jgi:flagellin-like protein
MRGISPVVASLLMIMITIALGGIAYVYISRSFEKYTCTEYKTENVTFDCNDLFGSYRGTCKTTADVCAKECDDEDNCRDVNQ